MHANSTGRRAPLLLLVAAAVVVLLLWVVDPALAAPRAGTTVARGVPAEAVARPATAGSGHVLTAASVRAPFGRALPYFVITPLSALLIGAVGSVLLLGAAYRSALAQRRSRGGRLERLTGRRPAQRDERRRAA